MPCRQQAFRFSCDKMRQRAGSRLWTKAVIRLRHSVSSESRPAFFWCDLASYRSVVLFRIGAVAKLSSGVVEQQEHRSGVKCWFAIANVLRASLWPFLKTSQRQQNICSLLKVLTSIQIIKSLGIPAMGPISTKMFCLLILPTNFHSLIKYGMLCIIV